MRTTHHTLFAAAAGLSVLLSACGGGNAGSGSQPIEPPAPPIVTAAEDDDINHLLVDLAAENVCDYLRGDFMALRSNDGGGETPGTAPVVGRLWVEDCRSGHHSQEEVTLELSGRGWQWVDKRSQTAGATFTIDQYVRLHTDVRMVGSIATAYDQGDHVLTAWYSPTEPVDATVRPIGNVDVEAQGLWSDVLSGVVSVVGQSPESRAESRIRQRGSNRFEATLTHGFTVAYDMCTAQRYVTVRRLDEGEIPGRPMDADGRLFQDNARVTLYPSGIDADGPYKTADGPVNVEVAVEQGPGVQARFVCESDVREVVTAFVEGADLPDVEARASALVTSEETHAFQASPESCELAVLFTPLEGAEEPTVFTYIVWHEGAEQHELVQCTDEEVRESDSALPEARSDGTPGEQETGQPGEQGTGQSRDSGSGQQDD